MIPTPSPTCKFQCECCDFSTSRQSQYTRHLSTDKHKSLQNPTQQSLKPKIFACTCGKQYKHSSSMYAHKKICSSKHKYADNEFIQTLVKHTQVLEQVLKYQLQTDDKMQEDTDTKEKEKQTVPKNIYDIVWNHYIGEEIMKHRCLCCKKVVITKTNFEVGHVISETNGGGHDINNLRPICGACNYSMGTTNMIEFVVKYGLYIG